LQLLTGNGDVSICARDSGVGHRTVNNKEQLYQKISNMHRSFNSDIVQIEVCSDHMTAEDVVGSQLGKQSYTVKTEKLEAPHGTAGVARKRSLPV
jgi:putative N-acetylmannosamine-6-phosphate epimerase